VTVHVNAPLSAFVEAKAKATFVEQRDAALQQVQPTLQGVLGQKQKLIDLLRTVDPAADAQFQSADFSQDGMVLRGGVSLPIGGSMQATFEELPGDGYTAFESWLPGGRITGYRWNWYWVMPGETYVFTGNAQVDKHEQFHADRFIVVDPGVGPDAVVGKGGPSGPSGEVASGGTVFGSIEPLGDLDIGQADFGSIPPDWSVGVFALFALFGQFCLTVEGEIIGVSVAAEVPVVESLDCTYSAPQPPLPPKQTKPDDRPPHGCWIEEWLSDPPPFEVNPAEWVRAEIGTEPGPGPAAESYNVLGDAVGPRDRLHQGVVPHQLVQVDGRTAWHVEAGHPHRTDKDQRKRVVGVLEPLVQILGQHPLAVRHDVEPLGPHLLDLVLRLRDHHGHVEAIHVLDQVLQLGTPRAVHGPAVLTLQRQPPKELAPVEHPVLADLVVHSDRRGLIDADDHRLATVTALHEVADQVLGDGLQAILARNQVILPRELSLELLFLLIVQLGRLK